MACSSHLEGDDSVSVEVTDAGEVGEVGEVADLVGEAEADPGDVAEADTESDGR